jgi:beta-galactosidase
LLRHFLARVTRVLAPGILLATLTAWAASPGSAETLPLYPGVPPGSEGQTGEETVRLFENAEHIVSNVHRPSIAVYLPPPERATGAGVIVIPGGGNVELWMDHEGYAVGQFLADHGIAAFVLKYRLAKAKNSTYSIEGHSLPDVQRAIRLVRSRSSEWGLDPRRVGVLGFSAGGNLAALASLHYQSGRTDARDPVERLSSRPDFQVLIYPGIPAEYQPTKDTPPALLLAGADDEPRISQGLANVYLALRQAGVPAEMHLYDGAGHGFGMRTRNHGPVTEWPQRLLDWMGERGIVGPAAIAPRHTSFNDDWRFLRADVPGAQQPGFDDHRWPRLRLPHDWAIEGPFDPKLNPHTGALPISGIGWYRKTFTLSRNHYYAIEFDGAMANSTVWLNGHELGGRPYGYSGFSFDLTPFLAPAGKPNVIAVRLAPEPNSSRWYPGAGIYRNVWLDETDAVSVARWGTYITTPKVTSASATVSVQTDVVNRLHSASSITVRSSILDRAGQEVTRVDTPVNVGGDSTHTVPVQLTLRSPKLWDVENPYLYTLVTEVVSDDGVIDRYVTPFGVRTIAFDAQKGFSLNGRYMKLHGVCMHHDLGALGTAVNRRAIERQLQILKGAGVNAIRTSHNPPAPELLEYADKMGFVVMDEAFDMWRIAKVPNGYSKYYDEWSERDLRDMVRRDRNHPSIILWSIGNEIPEQKSPDGWQEARRLTSLFHQEDPTRPTTSAFNNWDDAIRNKLADEVDIPGFNYKPTFYQRIHDEHPRWVIYGSETASCVSSRGTYHLPLENYAKHPSLQISSYDIIAPSWANCPDVEFTAQDAMPAVLGEFVWTGFDYIGEPTPFFGGHDDNSHDWPARSSYFGMIDLAGFPKDRYYLYQSVWTHEPMVHVLPHWNWQGHEGQQIPVMVYSNAEEVELSLNGQSLGRKKTLDATIEMPVGSNVSATHVFQTRYRLLWQVPYQAGALTATAYTHGKAVAKDEMHTAGPAAVVRLAADRSVISADGDDLAFVTVRVEDRDGHLVPDADNLVSFEVTGAGRIAAVDNGNAATVEPFHADHRKAFNGMALLIVRSNAHEAGQIRVSASSARLAPAQITLETR